MITRTRSYARTPEGDDTIYAECRDSQLINAANQTSTTANHIYDSLQYKQVYFETCGDGTRLHVYVHHCYIRKSGYYQPLTFIINVTVLNTTGGKKRVQSFWNHNCVNEQ